MSTIANINVGIFPWDSSLKLKQVIFECFWGTNVCSETSNTIFFMFAESRLKCIRYDTFGVEKVGQFVSYLIHLGWKKSAKMHHIWYKISLGVNMGETGLFYKIVPSKSICKNSRKGYKNLKDRVSIMLCSNMDGSEELKPIIMGKSKKPRCSKN